MEKNAYFKMTTKSSEKSVREKVDEFLHEKNYFTDGLEFVEKKTGVNRLYICLGKLPLNVGLSSSPPFVGHEKFPK